MATITISNLFFLSQGSSHNNIVKLQSDNVRDKKIIFLVLDHLKLCKLKLICNVIYSSIIQNEIYETKNISQKAR